MAVIPITFYILVYCAVKTSADAMIREIARHPDITADPDVACGLAPGMFIIGAFSTSSKAITYSIESVVPTSTAFTITDKVISCTASLVTESSYTLTFGATDGEGSLATKSETITFSVTPSPSLTLTLPSSTIAIPKDLYETSTDRATVIDFKFTVSDTTAIVTVVPIAPETVTDVVFSAKQDSSIDSSMGSYYLDLVGTLSGKSSPYTVRLQATLGNPATATANEDITVNLLERPRFTLPAIDPYETSIQETVNTGHEIVQLSATDPDTDDATLEFELKSIIPATNVQLFRVNGTVLETSVVGYHIDVDQEGLLNYTLKISVTDGTLSAETTILVYITDVNDNTPTFNPQPPLQVSILETKPLDTELLAVTAADGDVSSPNNEIAYSLSGTGNAKFAISNQGSITVVSALDYDQQAVYNLVVTATDQALDSSLRRSSTAPIAITLETAPAFTSPASEKTQTPLPENTAGDIDVYTCVVEDADNPSLTLTYSVTTVQPSTGTSWFVMDGSVLKTNQSVTASTFDLEPSNGQPVESFVVGISVTDGTYTAGTSLVVSVTDVNDNTPAFQNTPSTFSVFEGASIGDKVIDVTATDDDASSPNNEVTFSLSGQGNAKFTISNQGSITVASALDYDQQAVYNLVVTATDQALDSSLRRSSTAQITVTLETAPRFTSPASENTQTPLPEKTAGDIDVYTCVVEDADNPSLTLTYSVTTVQPSTGTSWFVMDGSVLKTNQSVTASTFDLEPSNGQPVESFVVGIRVTDGKYPAETSVIVNITDVNDKTPTFTSPPYDAQLWEKYAGGAFLSITATDDDASPPNNDVLYSLSGVDSDHFKIDEAGSIWVQAPSQLDYTSRPVYNLIITAADQPTASALSSTAELTVTLETAPYFTKPPDGNTVVIDLKENTGPDVGLYTCEVVDEDNQDPNSLTYSVEDVDPTSGTTYFRMDGVTLKTNSSVTSTTFDLDPTGSQQNYVITIGVTDGKYPTTAQVTLKVNDVNDNTPEFDGPVEQIIDDTLAIGQEVVKVTATDKDTTAAYNTVTYSIIGGGVDDTTFDIDSTTGSVTLKRDLKKAEYSFTVAATDVDYKRGQTTVTVNVRDTIKECNSSPCENGGTCYHNINYFFCDCADGWSGRTCSINIDECDSNPCSNSGTCIDGVNSYTCNCSRGWTSTQCTEACTNNNYGRNCADTCACNVTRLASGNEDQNCDVITGACFCNAQWKGDACETDVDECAEDTTLCAAQPNRVCVNKMGSHECICKQGYKYESQNCVEDPENKTVTISTDETTVRATFRQNLQPCPNLADPGVYAYLKADVEQKEAVRIATANRVKAYNLICGSLTYELAIVINDSTDARVQLALDLNDIRNGKPLVLDNQSTVTTGLNITGNTIDLNGTTDVSVQICEVYTSYVPCGSSYECRVNAGTPFCREKEKDRLALILGLALGLPLGILSIMCVVFVVYYCKRKAVPLPSDDRDERSRNSKKLPEHRVSAKKGRSGPPSYDSLDGKRSHLAYHHSIQYDNMHSQPSVSRQTIGNHGDWVFYSPATRYSNQRQSQRY